MHIDLSSALPRSSDSVASPAGSDVARASVAGSITSIANLPEDALRKLSGAKLDLGRGFSGSVRRACVEMPHPTYLHSAAKFVAVKAWKDNLSLESQSNAALVRIAGLDGDGRKHLLSAGHVGASGQVGVPLAHTTLEHFLRTRSVTCMDALVMVRDLALGLDALHAAGMVHGDMLPKNLLVGPGGYLIGDIDGLREGGAHGVCKASDIAGLYDVFDGIFEAVAISRAGAAWSGDGSFTASVSAELAELDGDKDRPQRVLARFSEVVASMAPGAHDEATLANLAALADDLVRALQGH